MSTSEDLDGRSGELASWIVLPPANTTRWVARRKLAVVHAVRKGTLSLEEALLRYKLSSEEFLDWDRLYRLHGIDGLKSTRIQKLRLSGNGISP